MITFCILLIALFVIAFVAACVLTVCGAGVIAWLADLIVFGLIIALFVKLFKKEK